MKVRTILLDDEPLALKQLENYAAKVPFLEVVAACTSALEAKEYLTQADVIFLDINMPDVSGMEFARSLENPPLFVFTTAYAEYAVEGFRVNAVDYLLKPFSLAEFTEAAEKVKQKLEMQRSVPEGPQTLYLKVGRKTITLALSSILYVESMSEYIKVYKKNGEEPLVILYSLTRLADELPSSQFMRIHRSYLIALDAVEEATVNSVTLKGGTVTLTVGEMYRPAFKDWLNSR